MAERLYIIIEAFTFIYILFKLNGRKYRIDINSVIFIAFDLILMTGINQLLLPRWSSYLIYFAIIIFCRIEFKKTLRKTVIGTVVCILFVSVIQVVSYLASLLLYGMRLPEIIQLNVISIVMLLVSVLITNRFDVSKLMYYTNDFDFMGMFAIFFGLAGFALCVYQIRIVKSGISIQNLVWICGAIVFGYVAVSRCAEYKRKYTEEKEALEAFKMYENSYKDIIENIRIKQHDIKNHINNIYVQSIVYDTYEELIEAQKKYCDEIIYDNRHSSLLKIENTSIAGFLYSKITEAEQKGIDTFYKIECMNFECNIPVYRMIEILGNLINNAIEELELREDRRMRLEITETNQVLFIEVMNVSEVIAWDKINEMFKKGISSKGTDRGLGLYSIKKLSKEYGFEIMCSNKKYLDTNWISFVINIEKGTVS